MPKNKVSEWSTTAASNTDIGGININEGCPPSGINNAIRELMAQVRDFQLGADGDGLTVSTLNATTATISGNVGIGTSSPSAKLGVVGPAGGASLTLTDATNSTLTIKHESPGNLLTYETAGTAQQRWVLNSTEYMRIDNAGNVGIGTSSPTSRLDVSDNLRVRGNRIYQDNSDGNSFEIGTGSGTGDSTLWGFYAPASRGIAFSTGGSPRLQIAASGAFGLSGANYGTSGQVLTSAGSGSAPTWGSPASLSTASGSAPSYSARAWVNFNGTETVSIRSSGNITSITDNGTGNYAVNISTAIADANYSVCVTGQRSGTTSQGTCQLRASGLANSAYTSSVFFIATLDGSGTPVDYPTVCASIHR
jgi:hypothetical protein